MTKVQGAKNFSENLCPCYLTHARQSQETKNRLETTFAVESQHAL